MTLSNDSDCADWLQRRRNFHSAAIASACRPAEASCVGALIDAASIPPRLASQVSALAQRLALGLRRQRSHGFGVDALLQEFSLSTHEGVVLMCVAESLLRIPDADNVDRLIRDKLTQGDWAIHLREQSSLFVNAVSWGLLISGKVIAPSSEAVLTATLGKLLARGGEPLIRAGMHLAMRLLGQQFVIGESIERALSHAAGATQRGYTHSFDMLGEAALNEFQAQGYLRAYEHAIAAIGTAHRGQGPYSGAGISVKLSALHPRYEYAQRDRVMAELLPRLQTLVRLARHYDIGFCIDAEEADRLELSLELFEAVLDDETLAGWNGLGLAVQAYQKRAPAVLDYLFDLAQVGGRRLMIRLVKGAYWDTEIKRAQVDGLADYPVFTRKEHTDISYLACSRKLLERRDVVYPQFATHNAHTVAAVYHLAGAAVGDGEYEFQCLYGMGDRLYDQVVGSAGLGRPCRVYAPVGSHQTLLPYLVRRLLENGANSSFVNRSLDEAVSIDDLIADPVEQARPHAGAPHPRICLPEALFGLARRNSPGIDLADMTQRSVLLEAIVASRRGPVAAMPILAMDCKRIDGGTAICNPADRGDRIGSVIEADAGDLEQALAAAESAAASWAATTVRTRADALDRAADLIDAQGPTLIALCVREAGKTLPSAAAEVREAVDYCRYYAAEIRAGFDNATHKPLGAVVCISPWNFPLAIFTGQVAAALAAGNAVLAKPAEQTPLLASMVVALLHEAGVPRGALQYLPGRGEDVGARLVADARIRGVLFTGSTAVAREIQGQLAERGDIPLIAETGGQNCMIVDSTALPEQVVSDVLRSAFDSAGQRCSSLRALCLQEEIADRVMAILEGALAELQVGDPALIASDVGPVIDAAAGSRISAHIERMRAHCRVVQARLGDDARRGEFIAPTLIEIDSLAQLHGEVFGPVLHVLRFSRQRLGELVDSINASGYGLTLGIHSRIDETVEFIVRRARVGNIYVNRNMIGAVVGVQPFGGEGLSGTGPKAGGPLYLHRLLADTPGPLFPGVGATRRCPELSVLIDWLRGDCPAGLTVTQRDEVLRLWMEYERVRPPLQAIDLPGPVGESNRLVFTPRGCVYGEANSVAAALNQIGAVVATGNRLLLPELPLFSDLRQALPLAARDHVGLTGAALRAEIAGWLLDADLAADHSVVVGRCRDLARREGPMVPLLVGRPAYDLTRLVVERVVSVNTAAVGGNAQLLTAE